MIVVDSSVWIDLMRCSGCWPRFCRLRSTGFLPHVLELESNELSLELQRESRLQLVLPETPGFLKADLSGDPAAALAKAEGGHS